MTFDINIKINFHWRTWHLKIHFNLSAFGFVLGRTSLLVCVPGAWPPNRKFLRTLFVSDPMCKLLKNTAECLFSTGLVGIRQAWTSRWRKDHMFRDLEDLLKANCLSHDPEGLRDFGMSSDGRTSAFSLRVVGFLVNYLLKVSLCWIPEATFLDAACVSVWFRRTPNFIHSSWVMRCQLHGSFIALAYILNNKSLLKAANHLVPLTCHALVSGVHSCIVAKTKYQNSNEV